MIELAAILLLSMLTPFLIMWYVTYEEGHGLGGMFFSATAFWISIYLLCKWWFVWRP